MTLQRWKVWRRPYCESEIFMWMSRASFYPLAQAYKTLGVCPQVLHTTYCMLLLDMLNVFISVTVSIVCNLYTTTMDLFFFGGGGGHGNRWPFVCGIRWIHSGRIWPGKSTWCGKNSEVSTVFHVVGRHILMPFLRFFGHVKGVPEAWIHGFVVTNTYHLPLGKVGPYRCQTARRGVMTLQVLGNPIPLVMDKFIPVSF